MSPADPEARMPPSSLLGSDLLIGPHARRIWAASLAPLIAGVCECRKSRNRPWPLARNRGFDHAKRARNKARRRAIKLGRRRAA